jgi:uncharacterized protein YndB with AHSA1/START domain
MTTTLIDETTLVLTRTLDAAPEAVFDAWMDREAFQSWIGPEGVTCDVPLHEPRVGGRYSIDMKMTDGRTLPVGGVFKGHRASAPPRLHLGLGRRPGAPEPDHHHAGP